MEIRDVTRRYRGQSYGVDITTLNRWGVRAAGVLPRDPTAYAAFGRPVLAPCSGTVVRAVEASPTFHRRMAIGRTWRGTT